MERIDIKEIKDIEDPCINDFISWNTRIISNLIWHTILIQHYIIDINVACITYNIGSKELIVDEFRIGEFKIKRFFNAQYFDMLKNR